MQITVIPASSTVGKATVRTLLAAPSQPTVRAIYRNLEKVPEDLKSHPRFEAVHGDVGAGKLDFGASQAVLYVAPWTTDGADNGEFAARAAANTRDAIERAGTVKRLVVQSALGSQRENVGILRVNRIADEALRDAAPRTFIVRPCTFYDMWKPALKAIQAGETNTFESYISPADFKIPMVSVKDVAEHCSRLLVDDAGEMSTDDVKVFGPRHYSAEDVASAIEAVTGKSVAAKAIPPSELRAWWAKQVPEQYAQEMVEFVEFQLVEDVAAEEYKYDGRVVRGRTELADELKEFLF